MKYLSYKKLNRLSKKYQTLVSDIQRKIIQCCQDRENFMHYVIMHIDDRPRLSFRASQYKYYIKDNRDISMIRDTMLMYAELNRLKNTRSLKGLVTVPITDIIVDEVKTI